MIFCSGFHVSSRNAQAALKSSVGAVIVMLHWGGKWENESKNHGPNFPPWFLVFGLFAPWFWVVGPLWLKNFQFTALPQKDDNTSVDVEFTYKDPLTYTCGHSATICLSTGLVTLDVVGLGTLQAYKKMVIVYHKRCGHCVWHFIRQTPGRGSNK